MNFAEITVGGHVGKDPETRQAGEASVTSFSIAVNKRGKRSEEPPQWYKCEFWGGRNAENVLQYVKARMEVVVMGSLETREYTKSDGTKGFELTVRANNFHMGSKNQTANGMPSDAAPRGASPAAATTTAPATKSAPAPTTYDEADDEIPF